MKKSYHSMVVPTVAAMIARRSWLPCRWSGNAPKGWVAVIAVSSGMTVTQSALGWFHPFCHPERSEGPLRPQERSLASLGMTSGARDDTAALAVTAVVVVTT